MRVGGGGLGRGWPLNSNSGGRGAAYATERGAKMADEEAEQDSGSLGENGRQAMRRLKERLLALETRLKESKEPAVEASTEYCQQLCQVRTGPSGSAPGVGGSVPSSCPASLLARERNGTKGLVGARSSCVSCRSSALNLA